MSRSEREQRIFIPKGSTLRVVMEGGNVFDISNRGPASQTIEHRTLTPRETQREELKAKFVDVLLPHVQARLNQHGYEVVGGDVDSGMMSVMETEGALRSWIEDARKTGITNQEILKEAKDMLKLVTIGAPRMGELSSLVRGINTEIADLVGEAWGEKRPHK